MNAHELAKILLEGPDIPVYIHGYEYGIHEVNEVEYIGVVREFFAGAYGVDSFGGRHKMVNANSLSAARGALITMTE